jgi:hypothetical protein
MSEYPKGWFALLINETVSFLFLSSWEFCSKYLQAINFCWYSAQTRVGGLGWILNQVRLRFSFIFILLFQHIINRLTCSLHLQGIILKVWKHFWDNFFQTQAMDSCFYALNLKVKALDLFEVFYRKTECFLTGWKKGYSWQKK